MSISRTSRNWLTLFEPNLQSGLNPISSYADYAQSFKTLYIISACPREDDLLQHKSELSDSTATVIAPTKDVVNQVCYI